MIFLAQVASDPTAADWVEAAIFILQESRDIGAKIYPFIAALNVLRLFASAI